MTPQTTLAPEILLQTRHHRLSLTPLVPWCQREAPHFQSRFRSRRRLCSLYFARQIEADLIVVGHKHRDGWAARWWSGSTSPALIEHAPCSVLVVITQ